MNEDYERVFIYKDGTSAIGRVVDGEVLERDGSKTFCSGRGVEDIAAEV